MIAQVLAGSDDHAPRARHVLVLASPGTEPAALPGGRVLAGLLERRGLPWAKATGMPLAGEVDGRLFAWLSLEAGDCAFRIQEAVRRALDPLLREEPAVLAVEIAPGVPQPDRLARLAVYVALVSREVRAHRSGPRLDSIVVNGAPPGIGFPGESARARGNLLARELTVRAPNRLTPGRFRDEIRALARLRGWALEEQGVDDLGARGAGAFCSVARGSPRRDAAIVRLRYRPPGATGPPIALAGKGICMDTGGYGMKPAREMHGMHEDMNGAAVALGILEAASALALPVPIDCWLAIADNLVGPDAYVPGEVVSAFDRTTIEVVNPDAEGRMVLADTLAIAASHAPAAILGFSTLTNAMVVALGTRMSGVFSNDRRLLEAAIACGEATGERVVAFPLEPDYDAALASEVADVRQCADLGNADHFLAALFLQRFVSGTPWVHVDLSAYRNAGGLGAVADGVTGFGVAWGVEMIERYSAQRAAISR